MTRDELARAVSDKCDITIKFSRELVCGVFDVIAETLAQGEDVRVTGFGSFKVVKRDARNAHNPQTLEVVKVPAHSVLKFQPTTELKEKVWELN